MGGGRVTPWRPLRGHSRAGDARSRSRARPPTGYGGLASDFSKQAFGAQNLAAVPGVEQDIFLDIWRQQQELEDLRQLIKILVDADSKEILGGAVLGIRGDEVVQALLPLMYAEAPYTVMSRAVHIHPTVTELLPTVLQGLRPLT